MNGYLFYLCIGCLKVEIYDFIWDVGFDGLIGVGGGYVEFGDEVFYYKKVMVEDVWYMVDFFNEY